MTASKIIGSLVETSCVDRLINGLDGLAKLANEEAPRIGIETASRGCVGGFGSGATVNIGQDSERVDRQGSR